MIPAPLSSTIVSLGLIPVAFFFVHAFYSGLRHKRFHPVTAVIAITWDLTLSIGYMLYRSLGGEIAGASIQLNQTLTIYFAIHGAIAVVVMISEILVLGTGIQQLRLKTRSLWHSRLSKILFVIWWFAFLTGELFYIVMYVI